MCVSASVCVCESVYTQKNRSIVSVPKGTFATKVLCKVQNMVLKVTTVDLCFNLKVQNQF